MSHLHFHTFFPFSLGFLMYIITSFFSPGCPNFQSPLYCTNDQLFYLYIFWEKKNSSVCLKSFENASSPTTFKCRKSWWRFEHTLANDQTILWTAVFFLFFLNPPWQILERKVQLCIRIRNRIPNNNCIEAPQYTSSHYDLLGLSHRPILWDQLIIGCLGTYSSCLFFFF